MNMEIQLVLPEESHAEDLALQRNEQICGAGILIGKQYWGQESPLYAAKQALRLCLPYPGYPTVSRQRPEVNVGSWRVMEKLGMRREGLLLRLFIRTGSSLMTFITRFSGKNTAWNKPESIFSEYVFAIIEEAIHFLVKTS